MWTSSALSQSWRTEPLIQNTLRHRTSMFKVRVPRKVLLMFSCENQRPLLSAAGPRCSLDPAARRARTVGSPLWSGTGSRPRFSRDALIVAQPESKGQWNKRVKRLFVRATKITDCGRRSCSFGGFISSRVQKPAEGRSHQLTEADSVWFVLICCSSGGWTGQVNGDSEGLTDGGSSSEHLDDENNLQLPPQVGSSPRSAESWFTWFSSFFSTFFTSNWKTEF